MLDERRQLQNVTQPIQREDYQLDTNHIIIGVLTSFGCLVIGFAGFYIVRFLLQKYWKQRKTEADLKKFMMLKEERKMLRIKQVIDDMKNGIFDKLQTKYHEDHCII